MAISDMDDVLDFLRKNGLEQSESAFMEDMLEKSELRSFDFEKFLFPMAPPPPQLRIPVSSAKTRAARGNSDSDSSSEEFVSMASSISDDVCAAEFINPYGIRAKTRLSSQASSDRLSQFGTARDYQDFDMQNNLFWYNEKDEDFTVLPHFEMSESFLCPSEDKFVMTLNKTEKIESEQVFHHMSEGYQTTERDDNLDESFANAPSMDGVKGVGIPDLCLWDTNIQHEGSSIRKTECPESSPSSTFVYNRNLTKCKKSVTNDWDRGFEVTSDFHNSFLHKDPMVKGNDNLESINAKEVTAVLHEQEGPDLEEDAISNQLLTYDDNEEDYEVFNLRIIHRKNRTGFEENKDLPIVLNSVIAGRYYVTEYLGSAAFSRVVQAHDLHTGIDVCLKIIKNDKDFFDQSLDEIKLLKFVNKHDPGDDHHILRLFDYFYYQEHLFIACELLRANLYEFQKYNQESGGEPYFTLSKLQLITRQCLEALEYLHHLGIIHCDLKPENILIKSYRRCEIKVIDLGSSCFQTDNLSLYVQSRSYRAPEVILGLPYDQKIDLWSLGCILVELCSGEVLFPNDTVVMLLARVIGMLGPIDSDMLVRGQEVRKYFSEDYDLYFTNEETNELEYIIPEESSLEDHLPVSDIGFIDFVKELLEINPLRRPTAREALEHPWLSHRYGHGAEQFS